MTIGQWAGMWLIISGSLMAGYMIGHVIGYDRGKRHMDKLHDMLDGRHQ